MHRIITCKLNREGIQKLYQYVTQSSRTWAFVSALLCKLGMELYSLVQTNGETYLLCRWHQTCADEGWKTLQYSFVVQLVQMRLIHAGCNVIITMATKLCRRKTDHGMHGWRWYNLATYCKLLKVQLQQQASFHTIQPAIIIRVNSLVNVREHCTKVTPQIAPRVSSDCFSSSAPPTSGLLLLLCP